MLIHSLRMAGIALAAVSVVACNSNNGATPPPGPGEPSAPAVEAGADQTRVEGETVQLSGQASDTDGTVTLLAWTPVGHDTSIQDAGTLTPTFVAPAVDEDTDFRFRLTATDDDGLTASDDVVITVRDTGTDPNLVPTVDAGPDQTVDEDRFVDLAGTASDADGTIASIIWTALDNDIELQDPGTLTPSFRAPQVNGSTTYRFRLSVIDNDGAGASDTVSIVVRNAPASVNVVPVAVAGVDQAVDEGGLVSLDGRSSSDQDGIIIGYRWTNASGLPFVIQNNQQPQASFVAPQVNADTIVTVRLQVTDNQGAQDSDEINVLVRNVVANLVPQANAGADRTVGSGDAVSLSGAASSDADGTIASYQWTQTLGDAVVLTGANTATASFTAPTVSQLTTLRFRLTVTDNEGAAASDEVRISVQPDPEPGEENEAPNAVIAVSSNPAFGGDTVSLSGSGSTDPDGDTLSYLWSEAPGSGCGLVFTSTTTASTSVTAPSGGGSCTVSLRVRDPDGLQDTTTTSLYVIPDLTVYLAALCEGSTDVGACLAQGVEAFCDALDPERETPVCGAGVQGDGFTARIRFGNSESDPASNGVIAIPDASGNITVRVAPYVYDESLQRYVVVPDGQRVDLGVFYARASADPVAGLPQQQGTVSNGEVVFTYNIADLPTSLEGNGYIFQAYYFGPTLNQPTRQSSHFLPKELALSQPDQTVIGLADALDDNRSPSAAFDGHPFTPVFVAALPTSLVQGDGFTARIQFGVSQADPGSNGVVAIPDANGNITVRVTPYLYDAATRRYRLVPNGQRVDLGVFYARADADPVAGLPQQQGTVSNGEVVFTYNIANLPSSLEGNGYIFQAYYFGASQQETTRQSSHFLPKEIVLGIADQNAIGLADAMDDNRSPTDAFDGHPFTPVFVAALPGSLVQGDGFTARIEFGSSNVDPAGNGVVAIPDANGNITVRVTPFLYSASQRRYVPVPDGQRVDLGVFYARVDADPVAGLPQKQGTVTNGQVVFTYNVATLPSSLEGNGYIFQAYYFGASQQETTRQSSHFLPKELILGLPDQNVIGLADAMDDNRSPTDAFDGHPFTPVFVAALPTTLVQGDGFTARIQFGGGATDPSGNGVVALPDAAGNITVRVTPYVFDAATQQYAVVPDGQRIDLGVFYARLDADPVAALPKKIGTVSNGQVVFTYNVATLPSSLEGNGYIFQAYYFGPALNEPTRQSSHFLPKELVLGLPDQTTIGLADAMDDNRSPTEAFDGHPFTPVFVAALPTPLAQGDGFTARIQFGSSLLDPNGNGVVVLPDADGDITVRVTPYVFDAASGQYVVVPDGQRVDLGVFHARLNADPVAGLPQQQGIVTGGQVIFTYNLADLPSSIDGNGYVFQAYYFGASQQETTRQSSHFLPKELALGIADQNVIGLADAMDDNRSPTDAFDGHPFTPVLIAALPTNLVQGDGFTARIEFGSSQADPSSNGIVVLPDANGDITVRVTPYVFNATTRRYVRVPDGQRVDLGAFYVQPDADPVAALPKKIGTVAGGQIVFTFSAAELPASLEGNGYIFQAYYFGASQQETTRQSSHFLPKELVLALPAANVVGLADAMDDNRSPTDAIDGHPYTPVFIAKLPANPLGADGFTARIQFGNSQTDPNSNGIVVIPDGSGNITVRVTPYVFNQAQRRYVRVPDGQRIDLGVFYARPDADPVAGLPQQQGTVSNGQVVFTYASALLPNALFGNGYIFQAYYFGASQQETTRQSSHFLPKDLLLGLPDQNVLGIADALDDNRSPVGEVDGHPFTPVILLKLF
ncbi:MAG TPA: PKD domain-containing protein [Fontimonas sp.]